MLRHQSQSSNTGNTINPYLHDQLRFMQQQEETHYRICDDYLLPSRAIVTAADRRSMCAWSFKIVRACAVRPETACIGISYFDRFLCTASAGAKRALGSQREFQLAFIACLVVALKCRAGMKVESRFVSERLCQNLYAEDEILRVEMEVLAALQWRVTGPSPHDFIGGFVALLPSRVRSHAAAVERWTAAACARAEAALLDYANARQAPSALAYDALTAAMQDLGAGLFRPLDRLAWMQHVALVTGKKVDDLSCRVVRQRTCEVPRSPSPTSPGRNCHRNESAAGPTPITVQFGAADDREMPRTRTEVAIGHGSPVSAADAAVAATRTKACAHARLWTFRDSMIDEN